jgi:DNA-binding MarR family transcriptional regulator
MTTELAATPARAAAPAIAAAPVAASDPRLDAWRSFVQAHARLTRRLDEELQAGHGLSLAEYDALLQLATAPGRRLRMSVLADRVLLSRSGITRLVDRLVAAGMVERTTCTTDARGAEAALTGAGLDRLRSASGTHLAGVGRLFLDIVTADEREVLGTALNRVLDNVGRAPGAADCVPAPATETETERI